MVLKNDNQRQCYKLTKDRGVWIRQKKRMYWIDSIFESVSIAKTNPVFEQSHTQWSPLTSRIDYCTVREVIMWGVWYFGINVAGFFTGRFAQCVRPTLDLLIDIHRWLIFTCVTGCIWQ